VRHLCIHKFYNYYTEVVQLVIFAVKKRTEHAIRAHLKEMLHQEPSIKIEDLFLEKHPISEKCLLFFEKISGPFRTKKLSTSSPYLALITPYLLTSTSLAKN